MWTILLLITSFLSLPSSIEPLLPHGLPPNFLPLYVYVTYKF